MEMLLLAYIAAWMVMRAKDAVVREYGHQHGAHQDRLRKAHPDWSPGRVRRSAHRRMLAHGWASVRGGFPGVRTALAEDWLSARIAIEKGRHAGAHRIRVLRAELDAAKAKRTAGEATPEPDADAPGPGSGDAPEPGPGTKPPLTVLPGGKTPEPAAETDPEPGPGTAEGPWLLTVRSVTGQPIPGTYNGTPVASVAVWDAEDLDRRLAAAAEDPDLETEVKPLAPPEPWTFDDDPPAREALAAMAGPLPAAACTTQDERDANGYGNSCAACGHLGSKVDPLVVSGAAGGLKIHESHAADPAGVFYDPSPFEHNATATEGDPVTETTVNTETGDSPYDAMLNAASTLAGAAQQNASVVGDDLRAAATVHGFNRDSATMGEIAAVEDAYATAAAAAKQLHDGMQARHEAGNEYHDGADAHASAFRPA